MKHVFAALPALALLAAVDTAHANPALANLPKPDSGNWEIKTTMVDMGGITMQFESCVDGTIEDMMKHPEVDAADCTDLKVEQRGNRVTARGSCTVEGSRADFESVFTGDFRKNYRGEIRSTYTPPLHGMKTTTMNIEGRWLSAACLPGMNPGDARMKGMPGIPGMGNIDLEALMKNMPGGAR